MSDESKPVVITTIVYPFDKGKRKIIVTGAPEGEMPVAHVGQFAELHALIDQTWLELLKRKPQVVRRATDKARGTAKASDAVKTEMEAAAELAGQSTAEEPAGAQVIVPADKDPDAPEMLDDLPEIQNEQETNA